VSGDGSAVRGGGDQVMLTQEEDRERQRQWREDRDRRLAERIEEQARLHGADPAAYVLPVDDPEFPDESYTAGWTQEEDA
jgi:hypothetical protein